MSNGVDEDQALVFHEETAPNALAWPGALPCISGTSVNGCPDSL